MLPRGNVEVVGQMKSPRFEGVYDVPLGESCEVSLVEVVA